ncbi:hypothetical protein [Arthrobacter sp. Soil762]|uniref:hypothetical protein n=1 Tax=Arthrobacter sp. Soil762 TaxID=1736401 RepID=UPI0006FB713C|nr:hypothetical protein [Arthrobacter sp. Soil762]KRE81014.1 hypothetical protein ASG77_03580 [Arthrobacter sp. Soil762]
MRSPAVSGAVIPTAILMALLLAGCGPQPGPTASPSPTVTSAATGTTTAVPTAAVSPSATGTAAASAAWTAYTTADGQLTFEHPAAWSIRDPAGELPEGGGAFAEVTNQAGKPLATLRTNMATGSTCLERFPYEVLEAEELPLLAQGGAAPWFVFETRGNDAAPGPANTPAAAYGITSVPAPDGDSACAIFHFFTWPPTAAMFGAFYNPGNNVTPGAESLPYLEQAKKYAATPEYRDIKRMITSLRPAV